MIRMYLEAGHPWSDNDDVVKNEGRNRMEFETVCLEADTEAERDSGVRDMKNDGWKCWMEKATRRHEDRIIPCAVLYRIALFDTNQPES